jgi:hypothetical protein
MSKVSNPPPDFYTGSPLEPEDLWFREEFIKELHGKLKVTHVVLSAPRRTGKTSVMDHLVAHPPESFVPISIFVQDIGHPAEFILLLLDAFHEKYPDHFRKLFQGAAGVVGKVLDKVGEIEAQGFKLTLREQEKSWTDQWRKYGDEFFAKARQNDCLLLLLVDEFPDMILNIHKNHPELVQPFLAWFRGHRLTPRPKKDQVRWLLCGSVNLSSTLDALGCLDLINDLDDIPLPPLTTDQIIEFVDRMLSGRGVKFDPAIPTEIATRLGQPVPVFLQMVTQDLHRTWKKHGRTLTISDVSQAFDDLIVTSGARDKLQHFYSRIDQYYLQPKRVAAYALLAMISTNPAPAKKKKLMAEFERILHEAGDTATADQRKQLFNQLMRDLENDFYVMELPDGCFDFASGLMKLWWKKYYA